MTIIPIFFKITFYTFYYELGVAANWEYTVICASLVPQVKKWVGRLGITNFKLKRYLLPSTYLPTSDMTVYIGEIIHITDK